MAFNPVIQAPDLSAASRVTPGVVDESGGQMQGVYANIAKTLGTLAVEGYKTYAEEGINLGVQDEIASYMRSKQNPSVIGESAVNLAQIDKEMGSLFDTPGTTTAQISSLEKEQKIYNDRMMKALQEGVIKPSEFSDRVLARLREGVNKNPGMYKELSAEAQRVLELSGISSILKADEMAMKGRQEQADWALKDTAARLREQDIPYDPTTLQQNLPYYLEQLSKSEFDSHLFKAQQRGETRRQLSAEAQARQYKDNGLNLVNGGLTSFSTTAQQLVDSLDTKDVPKAIGQLTIAGEQMKIQFKKAIPSEIIMDKSVQDTISMFEKGIDGIVKRAEQGATKEQMKTIISNEVAILKGIQDKRLRETVDVSSLELSSQIARNLPGFVQGKVSENMTNAALALSSGQYNSTAVNDLFANKHQELGEYVSSGVKIGVETGDYTGFKRVMGTISQKLLDPSISSVNREDVIYKNSLALAKTPMKGLDTEGIKQVHNMISMSMDGPYGVKTMLELVKQNKTNIDALPDGRLVFSGPMSTEMTAKFGSRFNTYLQAYANAHNMSTEQAAKRFYKDYFTKYIVGTPLATDKDIQ